MLAEMKAMTLDALKTMIEALPETEFAQLRRWMADRDWERWDEQLEADVALGKLDFLLDDVSEAIQLGTV